MSKQTILVIEDEKNILELVKYNLEKEGYQVLTALRGDLGLEMARKKGVDMILLDLMLPEINGLEICKILRQNPDTFSVPIIMLTAKGEEADKVIGLEIGADDYMTKPFSPRELIARIKALLRRIDMRIQTKKIKAGDLELDLEKQVASLKNKMLELTSKEFNLLRVLMEASGRLLSRDFLLEHVWGYDPSLKIETRTVDIHIGQIRKKLKSEAERLVTIKNAGYRFDNE